MDDRVTRGSSKIVFVGPNRSRSIRRPIRGLVFSCRIAYGNEPYPYGRWMRTGTPSDFAAASAFRTGKPTRSSISHGVPAAWSRLNASRASSGSCVATTTCRTRPASRSTTSRKPTRGSILGSWGSSHCPLTTRTFRSKSTARFASPTLRRHRPGRVHPTLSYVDFSWLINENVGSAASGHKESKWRPTSRRRARSKMSPKRIREKPSGGAFMERWQSIPSAPIASIAAE